MFLKVLYFKIKQIYANAYKDYCEMLMWEEQNERKKEMLGVYPIGWTKKTAREVAAEIREKGKVKRKKS